MKQYDISLFSTNDLALIAALATAGFNVHSFDKDSRGRATFFFDRDHELERAIKQYWDDQLLVNPRFYFDTLKHIKTRIYSER